MYRIDDQESPPRTTLQLKSLSKQVDDSELLRLPEWVVFVQQIITESKRKSLAAEKEKHA